MIISGLLEYKDEGEKKVNFQICPRHFSNFNIIKKIPLIISGIKPQTSFKENFFYKSLLKMDETIGYIFKINPNPINVSYFHLMSKLTLSNLRVV